jgi:hypothetical protein
MNGQAIVDRAEARFGDSSNAVYSAADWLSFVNDAYTDVVTADPLWPFLEGRDTSISLSVGDAEKPLPADVWHVLSVYNATDKLPLAPIPGRAEFRHYFPDPGAALGIPLYYRLRGNTIEFYPRPAATTAIHLDVLVPPAALATNTEPVFPEQFHNLLVYGALAKAYEDDENPEMAATFQGRFDRGIERMRLFLLSPRTEEYPQIQDTFF